MTAVSEERLMLLSVGREN